MERYDFRELVRLRESSSPFFLTKNHPSMSDVIRKTCRSVGWKTELGATGERPGVMEWGATFTAITMVIMAAEKLQFSKIQICNLRRIFVRGYSNYLRAAWATKGNTNETQ
jgi:hypothetical protein